MQQMQTVINRPHMHCGGLIQNRPRNTQETRKKHSSCSLVLTALEWKWPKSTQKTRPLTPISFSPGRREGRKEGERVCSLSLSPLSSVTAREAKEHELCFLMFFGCSQWNRLGRYGTNRPAIADEALRSALKLHQVSRVMSSTVSSGFPFRIATRPPSSLFPQFFSAPFPSK